MNFKNEYLKPLLTLLIALIIFSCKSEERQEIFAEAGEELPVEYAKGFTITQFDGYKIVEVKNPWPMAEKTFRYLLVEDEEKIPTEIDYDEKIKIPVERMVVTSTTHIPSLEILGEEKSLIGFPGLDFISSEKTRSLINKGAITELGQNDAINTEVLLAIEPDAVVGFAVNGYNKKLNTISKSGIPVILNGDWIEESPLGKAEWIKFFGALFDKTNEAENFFKMVEIDYQEAKSLAATSINEPSVLSGSMFKDQWYVPYGNSWQAQFFRDANSKYIYEETVGSGSKALAFETVLNEAQNAKFWIAPGQFYSYQQLKDASPHYDQFSSVKNKNVYTYSNTKGEKGGVLYYELAPVRPDLVLKDLISIFHPHLLPGYERTFYKALE